MIRMLIFFAVAFVVSAAIVNIPDAPPSTLNFTDFMLIFWVVALSNWFFKGGK